jgi:hypothetical protein
MRLRLLGSPSVGSRKNSGLPRHVSLIAPLSHHRLIRLPFGQASVTTWAARRFHGWRVLRFCFRCLRCMCLRVRELVSFVIHTSCVHCCRGFPDFC